MAASRDTLENILIEVIPFLEDMKDDPCYKKGVVNKVLNKAHAAVRKVETNKEARERHQSELEDLYKQYGTAALLQMLVKARDKASVKYKADVSHGAAHGDNLVVKQFDEMTRKLEQIAFKGNTADV